MGSLFVLFFGTDNVLGTFTSSSYEMDDGSGDTVSDSGDSSLDGTKDSTHKPDWFSSGDIDGLEFDGNSQFQQEDHVHVDDDGAYEFDSSFQITSQLYLDSNAYWYNTICSKYYYDSGSGYAYGYQFRFDNEYVRFTIYDGDATPKNVWSNEKAETNKWINVYAEYNSVDNYIMVGWYFGSTHSNDITSITDGDEIEYHASMPDFHIGQNSHSWGGYQPYKGKMNFLDIDIISSDPDQDNDGRPDEFEEDNGLITDPTNSAANDVEWTFLVYAAGDDCPDGDPSGALATELWESIERFTRIGTNDMGCTDNINIVVQYDGTSELNPNQDGTTSIPDYYWDKIPNNDDNSISPTPHSTRRFLVGQDNYGWNNQDLWDDTIVDLWDVTNWDPMSTGLSHSSTNWEANMAHPETLIEFVHWGTQTFPSDFYCLYYMGHGDGVSGFAYDYNIGTGTTSTKDVLTLSEANTVQSSLLTVGCKLDLMVMESCFLGNIDLAHTFQNLVDVYVSSENEMRSSGNQNDAILTNLENQGDNTWTSQRLGQEFVYQLDQYCDDTISVPVLNIVDYWGMGGAIEMTYSAMDMSIFRTSTFLTDFTTFCTNLINGINNHQSYYLTELTNSVKTSSTDRYFSSQYSQIDLYNFINYWDGLNPTPPRNDPYLDNIQVATSSIKNVLSGSNPIIYYEKHNTIQLSLTEGIALYMPISSAIDGGNTYSGSIFDTITDWGTIVDEYADTL